MFFSLGPASPAARGLTCLLALAAAGTLAPSARAHGPANHEIETLSERMESAPPRALDVLRRGELHRVMGHWRAAAEDYDRAEALDPTLVDVQVCRAALQHAMDEPEAARRTLDAVLRRDPAQARARELRAQVLEAMGSRLDAVADLDRLIATSKAPPPDWYVTRARLLAEAGSQWIPRAIEGLDQGIATLGPLVSLESPAVDLERALGRHDAALARLETLAPQIALRDYLERRGLILAAAGRDAEARAAFAAALAEIESLSDGRRRRPAVHDQEARLRATLEEGRQP